MLDLLGLPARERDMAPWYSFTAAMHEAEALSEATRVAVVGKYTQLPDAYLSVIEALHHSGVLFGRHVDIRLVDGEALTSSALVFCEMIKDAAELSSLLLLSVAPFVIVCTILMMMSPRMKKAMVRTMTIPVFSAK